MGVSWAWSRSNAKMDSLLQGFQSGCSVSFDVNDPIKPHPRFSEFKFKREGYGEQESRRRKLMEEQKSRRREYMDYARMITEEQVYSDEDIMEEEGFDEVDGNNDSSKKTAKKKSMNPFKNQIMLSEWMVDVPIDFEEKWYMVVCPVAKRCLIISHSGKTTAYNRTGHFFKQFPSSLPGGSRDQHYSKNNYCILDCLFHEGLQTFFVLDIMCWGGHPVYDSDTDFRFFWLNSKLDELGDEVLVQSRTNPYKFIPLQYHVCSMVVLHQVLQQSVSFEVDGLLFFHKEALYFRGRSPIVLWLKPHMIHDILHVTVSDAFLACVPVVSSDVSMEMDKKTVKKKICGAAAMDTGDIEPDNNTTS